MAVRILTAVAALMLAAAIGGSQATGGFKLHRVARQGAQCNELWAAVPPECYPEIAKVEGGNVTEEVVASVCADKCLGPFYTALACQAAGDVSDPDLEVGVAFFAKFCSKNHKDYYCGIYLASEAFFNVTLTANAVCGGVNYTAGVCEDYCKVEFMSIADEYGCCFEDIFLLSIAFIPPEILVPHFTTGDPKAIWQDCNLDYPGICPLPPIIDTPPTDSCKELWAAVPPECYPEFEKLENGDITDEVIDSVCADKCLGPFYAALVCQAADDPQSQVGVSFYELFCRKNHKDNFCGAYVASEAFFNDTLMANAVCGGAVGNSGECDDNCKTEFEDIADEYGCCFEDIFILSTGFLPPDLILSHFTTGDPKAIWEECNLEYPGSCPLPSIIDDTTTDSPTTAGAATPSVCVAMIVLLFFSLLMF